MVGKILIETGMLRELLDFHLQYRLTEDPATSRLVLYSRRKSTR